MNNAGSFSRSPASAVSQCVTFLAGRWLAPCVQIMTAGPRRIVSTCGKLPSSPDQPDQPGPPPALGIPILVVINTGQYFTNSR